MPGAPGGSGKDARGAGTGVRATAWARRAGPIAFDGAPIMCLRCLRVAARAVACRRRGASASMSRGEGTRYRKPFAAG